HLPEFIYKPKAILYDKQKADAALTYVIDLPQSAGKLVVFIDRVIKARPAGGGKPERITTHLIRTGKVLPAKAFDNPGAYEVLWGSLE
ncbi:phage head morphogenesis protein, partial [Dickeya undicola]